MRQRRKPSHVKRMGKPMSMSMGNTFPKKAAHTSTPFTVGLLRFRIIVEPHSIYEPSKPVPWRLERNGETVASGTAANAIEAQRDAKSVAREIAEKEGPKAFQPRD